MIQARFEILDLKHQKIAVKMCISDGLIDCGDSKCCSHPSCKNNIMCMYLADPVDVLLRKPPPTVSASFLSRVRFLFEGEESVQNYAKLDTFDEK